MVGKHIGSLLHEVDLMEVQQQLELKNKKVKELEAAYAKLFKELMNLRETMKESLPSVRKRFKKEFSSEAVFLEPEYRNAVAEDVFVSASMMWIAFVCGAGYPRNTPYKE